MSVSSLSSIPLADPSHIRVLVTGSRDWDAAITMQRVFLALLARCEVGPVHTVTVVHGGARGADQQAGHTARLLGAKEEVHMADWTRHGRGAGHIRNADMLAAGRPDFAVAFKADFDRHLTRGGTENMVGLLLRAGVPTWLCSSPSSLVRLSSRLPLDLSDAVAGDLDGTL